MIFSGFPHNEPNDVFESYKERNFYYKLFAGYLFNELLQEYHKNKNGFFGLLKKQIDVGQHFVKSEIDGDSLRTILDEINKSEVHVSFDYHVIQVDKDYRDRGEVSDVIIWGEKHFISIEVKYLSDWTFDKDVEQVQQRIIDMGTKTGKEGIQVLLLSEKKWLNNQHHKNQTGSNLATLIENNKSLQIPLIIITWEQLAGVISNQQVVGFINAQLKRKR